MTAPMPRPGERVGPYRLLEVAGEGGMGVVYRAADTALHDRIVAVKVMAAHLSAELAYRAAFLHEAHVAAEVSHPHVVPVHAAGEADGLLYLAMAWIEGRDLRVLASLGDLSAARAVAIVRQIARALDAVHDAGIVHGDVKPSNVLVHREDGEDHAYLLDFGVARRTTYADPRTNELVGGTPAYAAPETASGPPDPATDRYSLACVVFELLTGERPFGSGSGSVLARRHADAPRPRVSDVVPELVSFDAVVARAMARDPAERYPSGAEFGRALDRAQRASDEPTTLVMLPRRREPAAGPEEFADPWAQAGKAWAERDAGDDARREAGAPAQRPDDPWAQAGEAWDERESGRTEPNDARRGGGTPAQRQDDPWARAGEAWARREGEQAEPDDARREGGDPWTARNDARREGGDPWTAPDDARRGNDDVPARRDDRWREAPQERQPASASASTRLRPRAAAAGRGRGEGDPPTVTHRGRRGARVAAIGGFVVLLVAVAAAGYFVFKPGGDDLAKRQAAADRKVVTRLVEHFATALKGADADLLARTVSANVVRRGSDGNEPPKCVIDRGSKDAIVALERPVAERRGLSDR